MSSHDVTLKLVASIEGRSLNEANTRHQIIDPLLHDVMGWPRARVKCEEYISPGFADYVLERSDGSNILLIEAKKEGHFFTLPHGLLQDSLAAYVQVKTLQTDVAIRDAINQVREYCLNVGCEIASITNGHEWIFFKTFQKGQDWRSLKAFVISSPRYFSERFSEAINFFSYLEITEKGSLRRLLLDSELHNRQLFYPKLRISSYEAPVNANQFASSLRPIADKYFGDMEVDDSQLIDNCYVSDREYDIAFMNARRRLEDAITPYLEQYNIQQTKDGDTGGAFANRLKKGVIGAKSADVVVLFGGKGVGKSTFLRKLLFHKPPQVLRKSSIIALIDLLNAAPEANEIRKTILETLVGCLDEDKVLSGSRDQLCQLFSDRFDLALKQDLFNIDASSPEYNIALNKLIAEWKGDLKYVASRLANYWRLKHKAIIVVIDNTDQFKFEMQESCFALAQEISSLLQCLAVISMREERFFESSIHGVLDAYQNSGFHISAPEPKEVFLKRVEYVEQLLRSPDAVERGLLPSRVDVQVCQRLFRVFREEFNGRESHLRSFLTACSHGNIRQALHLFRGFLVSGYTNVQEMTATDRWTLQIHQVIKPFMIPSRFFYDEKVSEIPNVLQIRSKAHGSHFTALRILSRLHSGHDASNPPFVPVAKLLAEFSDIFGMREDFELNLDMLLRHGFVEANNRLDEFSVKVDSIKITAYGLFMLNALSKAFTYLELICSDCAIADQGTANSIAALSNDDYRLYVSYEKMKRVRTRIEKADVFICYLEKEEDREVELFKIYDLPKLSAGMRLSFNSEKLRVLRSAKRNVD